jgi:methionyl aminopeptidase
LRRIYPLFIGPGEVKKKKKKKKPKKKKKVEQGDPPRTGLSKVYPDGKYPVGEIKEYKNEWVTEHIHCGRKLSPHFSNAWRTTSEEKRYLEKLAMEDPNLTYENIRRGAEVHRLVRNHARKFIHPGMTMTDIANGIEDTVRALVEENGLEAGIGFPTGLSRNNCAAHYTPNANDSIGGCVNLSRMCKTF